MDIHVGVCIYNQARAANTFFKKQYNVAGVSERFERITDGIQ